MTLPDPWAARSASTPAKIGSGFITIPPPPPKGGSSVTRCFPSANSRRSWTATARRPEAAARARMLWSRGPEKMPGKRVRTSTRTLPSFRGGRDDAAPRDVHRQDEGTDEGQQRLLAAPLYGQPVVGGPGLDAGDDPEP